MDSLKMELEIVLLVIINVLNVQEDQNHVLNVKLMITEKILEIVVVILDIMMMLILKCVLKELNVMFNVLHVMLVIYLPVIHVQLVPIIENLSQIIVNVLMVSMILESILFVYNVKLLALIVIKINVYLVY